MLTTTKTTHTQPHGSDSLSQPDLFQPVTLMNAASVTCNQATLQGTPNAISSRELLDGLTRCNLPTGQQNAKSGQAVARVSRGALQESNSDTAMTGTSGQCGSGLSKSAVLQSCLESRLQARLTRAGLMELSVTWKARVTPSGRRYFQRVPRMHRIDVTGSGSLPTPSGTSNHGRNHVAGRIDEWGGSSNCFRGTEVGRLHLPGFELWAMGYPDAWRELMPPGMPSARRLPQNLSGHTSKRS
jgi:hypothetical protein